MELFGESIPLSEFPVRKDITGIGMSDWDVYTSRLAKKLGYTNTFYHKEPKLDIISVDDIQNGKYDFIISSDVFEHVVPPVSTAFYNTGKLLKRGGVLIFSVPYISTPGHGTVEHFPDLYQYKIINMRQGKILKNITAEGVSQTYTNLTFHGGKGNTLEMRSFSESSLWDELRKAGFKDIKKYNQSYKEYGIVWTDEHITHCSPPLTARI
ncbi:methyltransferase domain-containing protein [Methanocella paludicola]|nr:methyltransferase domain-containing protein [Methanocella paludicola]